MAGGRAIRARFPDEARPDPCGYGCDGGSDGDGACFVEAGFSDPEAERVARLWHRCGGRARTLWPKPGGADDQDAEIAVLFPLIDREVAKADRSTTTTEGA